MALLGILLFGYALGTITTAAMLDLTKAPPRAFVAVGLLSVVAAGGLLLTAPVR
jgi:hypothetical protein